MVSKGRFLAILRGGIGWYNYPKSVIIASKNMNKRESV